MAIMGAGLPTAIQEAKGGSRNERQCKFSTHKAELQIPHSIFAKVSPKRDIWESKERHRRNDKKALRLQERRNN
jgi:hypothetical protein